jgi:hypothetical protein
MFGAWDLHLFYFINMQIGDCFSTGLVFQIAPSMSRAMEQCVNDGINHHII